MKRVSTRFSPQAWGCTEGAWRTELGLGVFPTGVGVYPPTATYSYSKATFSPQAWGCTGMRQVPRLYQLVFPTGVGVYRYLLPSRQLFRRFPHRRGGVPNGAQVDFLAAEFSPQAWGCTADGKLYRSRDRVFPTGVGVYRA